MKRTIVEELTPETVGPYYRNQVQDSRGKWRDTAPSFATYAEAHAEAVRLVLDEGKTVSVARFE